jgi:hypothetical protein
MKGPTKLGIFPEKANLGFRDFKLSKMAAVQHSQDLMYTLWESMDSDAHGKIMKTK